MGEQNQSSGSCGDIGNSGSLLIENSPQKQAKIEIECEETGDIDWISKLPDALIIHILSLLSVTDAFSTTILSKRWKYLWTSIDNFIYGNEEYIRSDSLTVQKFISLTDNVLPQLSCSSIKKFRLNFMFNVDDGVSYYPEIDKLLEFAVNKKMEDLRLNICYTSGNDKPPYSLPKVLCNSSSILKLVCKNCRILEDCVINWISLRSLSLEGLFVGDEHIKQIMSNCPQLESLKLYGFCGFNRLHLTSPKCRRLQLIDHYHYDGEDDRVLEIVAPYVQHLTISGIFDHTKIKLGDLSSLDCANLTLRCDEFDAMDDNIVKGLLIGVRCANELIVSSWFIKVISYMMLKEEDVFLPLLDCRWLTISSSISKLFLPVLDKLLRSTPNLENLMIFRDISYHPFFQDEDIDLSEDNYLSLQDNIFKVSLKNLKNMKVMPSCNRTSISDTTKLHQFLIFLLEHAINLEKLVIVPAHKGCNRCSTDISELMKYLLAFPRTSDSAIISLGSVTKNVFYSYV